MDTPIEDKSVSVEDVCVGDNWKEVRRRKGREAVERYKKKKKRQKSRALSLSFSGKV
jgi:hypothetical protein